jgi:hypothetical protein
MNRRSSGLFILGILTFVFVSTAGAQTVLYTFDGGAAGDLFGRRVSDAGDVNKDGVPDVVVGIQGASANGPSSGGAQVFSGLDGSVLYTFDGESAGDLAGFGVTGAGDVNNDGYADIILGAFGDDNNGSNSGSARVYSGFDGSELYLFNGAAAGDNFGGAVSGLGDVNGDGFDDLLVGAAFTDVNGAESGSAYVFSGLDGSTLYTLHGNSAGDLFGVWVLGAGDVNADGVPDFIVGAPNDEPNGTRSGSASVYSGADGTVLYLFNGQAANLRFGRAVAGAGDANADGYADLIVGAPDDSTRTTPGTAQVFSGRDGSVLLEFTGQTVGDVFGLAVSSAGDVNADGFADVVIGALREDANGIDSGAVYVYSGRDGRLLFKLVGAGPDDLLGGSVSGAGDIDGDGFAEVIAGAHQADANGMSSGSAIIASLAPSSELAANLLQALLGLNLPPGLANSLVAKVESALETLEDGNPDNDQAAAGSLSALIHAIEAQRGKKISEADAALLIASAQDIIARIAAAH